MIDSPRPEGVGLAIGKPVIYDGHYYSFFAEGGSSTVLRMMQRRFGSLPLYRNKVGSSIEAWQSVALPVGNWSVKEGPHIFLFCGDIFVILTKTDNNSRLFRFDSPTGWVCISSFPRRLLQFAVAVVNHILLVIGGKNSQTGRASKSVHALDLRHAGSEWSKLDYLPCNCLQPVAVVWNTSVHVFQKSETRVLSIDVSASELDRKWSYDVLPPVPSDVQCTAVVNGCLVVAARKSFRTSLLMYVPECRQYLPLPVCNVEKAKALLQLCEKMCLVEVYLTKLGEVVKLHMLSV